MEKVKGLKITKKVEEVKVVAKVKNMKDFAPKDLSGNVINIQEPEIIIGNTLFFAAVDIAVHEMSAKIYKKEDFEVTPALLQSVENAKDKLAPWLISAFTKFLNA